MSRYLAVSIVTITSGALSGLTHGTLRFFLIGFTVACALIVACWGSREERRLDEAHIRIMELSREVAAAHRTAEDAQRQAYKLVTQRKFEEDRAFYDEFSAIPGKALKRLRAWLSSANKEAPPPNT